MGVLAIMGDAIPVGSGVDFTWLFLKMLFLLGAVCVAAVLILKYLVPTKLQTRWKGHNDMLKPLARLPLSPKSQLWVVQAGKRYFMIGASDAGVQLMSELNESDIERGE